MVRPPSGVAVMVSRLLKRLISIISPGRARRRFISGIRLCPPARRSEEHTSELQSHSDLVCRLLLEKKNDDHDHDAAISSKLHALSRRCDPINGGGALSPRQQP